MFTSDLPTLLIAAFQATLEEVVEADLILHVRDISHPETDTQSRDVLTVLKDLDLEEAYEARGIEVLNKSDLLENSKVQCLKTQALRASVPPQCVISAIDGAGVPDLLDKIDSFLASKEKTYDFSFSVSDGKKIAWLYAHGEILKREDDEIETHIKVKLSSENKERFDLMKRNGF